MILLLFRHGIAIDRADPDCPPDPERFLTERGIARTRSAALGIARLGMVPEIVISSPYVRARQTAEIAIEQIGVDRELEIDESLIWDREPSEIADKLRGRDESVVMLVGHAPHLDDLASYLIGTDRDVTQMKKASLLVVEAPSPEPGRGWVVAHYPPRALRALGG